MHDFIIQNNLSKRFDSESPPGAEHQMNPPIGFAPLKSIDFAPSAPIFTFCFEPNDRSRPAKPRVKTNYLPSGIPLIYLTAPANMLGPLVALVAVVHVILESWGRISWDLCILGVLIHLSYFWVLWDFTHCAGWMGESAAPPR